MPGVGQMIRTFAIWAVAAVSMPAVAQAPAADDAGNRSAPLTIAARVTDAQAETLSTLHCSAGRDFCLRARRDGETGPWTLEIRDGPAAASAVPDRRVPLPVGEDAESEVYQIWPHVVHEASGSVLIGVERYRRAGFSGGGASETSLLLLRVTGDGEPEQVLSVQSGYTATIRACFSPADHRRLGDACQQQLEYSATLTLAATASAGRPRFDFAATARNFPRGARVEGWETRPLRRADRVWENDPACTYRRVFAFDAASGRYGPDRPPPDCSTYTLP